MPARHDRVAVVLTGKTAVDPTRRLLPDGNVESLPESVRTDEDIIARYSVDEVRRTPTLSGVGQSSLTDPTLATLATPHALTNAR